MILNQEQLSSLMGTNEVYKCELLKQRFSYYLFGSNLSPTGNIVSFEYPTLIGALPIKKALVFATDIPNSSIFGGICFQRLFVAQLGSLFSEIYQQECHVDGSVIIADEKQVNISAVNRSKDSILTHTIFNIDSDIEGLYNFSSNEDNLLLFKERAVGTFHNLTQSIFIETQRDNF